MSNLRYPTEKEVKTIIDAIISIFKILTESNK